MNRNGTSWQPAAGFRPYIDGRWIDSDGPVNEVLDPATEEVIAQGHDGTVRDVEAAITAARTAFDDGPWGRMSGGDRRRILIRFAEALDKRRAAIADLVIAETGAIPAIAERLHVGVALDHFAWAVEQADRDRTRPLPPLPGHTLGAGVVVKEPCGVVGAISAYNFPFFLNMAKLGGALATGNTVVLKPSPMTPLEAFVLVDAAHDADLPPGVLNIVSGDVEVSQALTTDPRVDVLTFTGSERVGALVSAQAAPNITRVHLELGGKSALIVRSDADLADAVGYGIRQIVTQAGQGCALSTRHLVHRDVYRRYVDMLVAAASRVKTGLPREDGVGMGPLIREHQVARVEHYVDLARQAGGVIETGGARTAGLDRGFFYDPTVITGLDNSATTVREEIFGPVAVVLPFDDDAEAVRIANDSPYGLGGHIYSADTATAFAMCRQIRSGYLAINGGAGAMHPAAPFGGFKRSGLGREYGDEGLEAFLETKAISFHAG
ncbi:aldehyde dehydrogenase family protein [Gordonia metallireducens]|uniref:aldehyde dehydrogenase family protein n=1 Tax=Gordonia metallireducens TaxID=2897779 RepID=UPI001E49A90B|nr:aldehyde dehydrogenase family protein [Gordonia metallireducens]